MKSGYRVPHIPVCIPAHRGAHHEQQMIDAESLGISRYCAVTMSS